jgi:PKD repeat protein
MITAPSYVYGTGTPTVTITSPYGTDEFDIPAGETVERVLTGTGAGDVTAAFFALPTTGWSGYFAPEFVNLSTGWVTDYEWSFGDGETSTEMAPHHYYELPGNYTVTLTVAGPGGSDMEARQAYIQVKDFSNYSYSDYVLTSATQSAFDSALDTIENSQTEYDPCDYPAWCNISTSNDWCAPTAYGGGGRILFDSSISSSTINIDWDSREDSRIPSGASDAKRDWFGDNLIIDGEDKNMTFYYNGTQDCGQGENRCAFRIHGNDNIVRNVTWDRFPDGLHMRAGERNLIEGVTVNTVCEDAMTFNGAGNVCIQCISRDNTYGGSTDKTFMIGSGGSLGSAVICGMDSTNGNQPIRVTGGGMYIVRNSTFRGNSQGPRFGGEGNLIIFENNLSTNNGQDTMDNGVRISDSAFALIRHNTIENCENYGIYGFNDGYYIRAEYNTISGCGSASVFCEEKGVVDLGGGLVDVFEDAGPWLPAATYPTTDPIASEGRNDFSRTGVDVINSTYETTPGDLTMKAENNFWDHSTVGDVTSYDITGVVDVDPLGIDIE